jgi:hypothetical protein
MCTPPGNYRGRNRPRAQIRSYTSLYLPSFASSSPSSEHYICLCLCTRVSHCAVMRSDFALSMLLASPPSTVTAPDFTGEGFGPDKNVTCGRDCYANTFGAGCTDSNTACMCKPDYNLQVSLLKCVFGKCPPVPAEISWSRDTFACTDNPAAMDKLLNLTQGTPAEAFDIPGEYCILLSSSVVRALPCCGCALVTIALA